MIFFSPFQTISLKNRSMGTDLTCFSLSTHFVLKAQNSLSSVSSKLTNSRKLDLSFSVLFVISSITGFLTWGKVFPCEIRAFDWLTYSTLKFNWFSGTVTTHWSFSQTNGGNRDVEMLFSDWLSSQTNRCG